MLIEIIKIIIHLIKYRTFHHDYLRIKYNKIGFFAWAGDIMTKIKTWLFGKSIQKDEIIPKNEILKEEIEILKEEIEIPKDEIIVENEIYEIKNIQLFSETSYRGYSESVGSESD